MKQFLFFFSQKGQQGSKQVIRKEKATRGKKRTRTFGPLWTKARSKEPNKNQNYILMTK
jgi:hypothetical protein